MKCLSHQHENPPGALFCGVCDSKVSALANGRGLPSQRWELLDPPQFLETTRSIAARARDRATGEIRSVREYFPFASAELPPRDNVRLRGFIAAARSLRGVAVPAMRVLFAYTSVGRWYTVSETVTGTPLHETADGRPMPAPEVRKWFRAILVGLDAIHTEAIETGTLHHGDVTLENILVATGDAGYRVQLVQSTYLEQFAEETRLPPEHFVEQDLRGAGLCALRLLDGRRHTGDQAARLNAIGDTVLGATLDYLLRPGARGPGSARHLLRFFDDLSRAESERSLLLYQAAFQMSGSARLRPILNAPPPVPPRASPATPPQPAPPPPPVPPPVTSATSPQESAPPPEPAPQPAVLPAERRRSVGSRIGHFVGATILLLGVVGAGLLLGLALLIRSLFAPGDPKPPTISADPASIRRGQSSLLQWSAKGFAQVDLDGQPVGQGGSRTVSPAASTTYRLTARDPSGKSQFAETRLIVTTPGRGGRRPDATSGGKEPGHGGRSMSEPGTGEPPAVQLASARPQINFGDSTEIRWAATHANAVRMRPALEGAEDPLTLQGSANISPSSTTTYTLTAQGDGGRVTESVTIRVVPTIVGFRATPTGDGCTWRLRADVQGARKLWIEPREGLIESRGQTLVRPIRDTTFTLSAQGAGTLASTDLQIRVSPQTALGCFARSNR